MTIPLLRLLRGALCCASIAALAVASASAAETEVLARVGDVEVTRDELRAYLDTLGAQERAALGRDPALLSQTVRSHLARRLLVKAAQAKGLERQPAVKAQLERVRDDALAELYLQSVSQPPEGFPGDSEVKAAYEARPEAFDTPPQYRVAHIFIAAPKAGDARATEKARQRLDATVKRLAAKGADFGAIARESSDERSSAEKGGELGWLAEAQMVPGIRAALLKLSKGAVTEPIRLEEGWHVVKLLDARPASRRPLSEVREALAAQLRADLAQANRRVYLSRLLEENPPVVNELALSNLLQKSR